MTIKERLELCIYRMESAIREFSEANSFWARRALSYCLTTKETLEIALGELQNNKEVQEFSPVQEEVQL